MYKYFLNGKEVSQIECEVCGSWTDVTNAKHTRYVNSCDRDGCWETYLKFRKSTFGGYRKVKFRNGSIEQFDDSYKFKWEFKDTNKFAFDLDDYI